MATGYPGWREWTSYLTTEWDIPEEHIAKTQGKGLHTRTETDDFVFLAKKRGWTDGFIISNQHEVLRVMLGVLKSFDHAGHRMNLWPLTPTADWNQDIYGSQGQIPLPRALHISEELRRVGEYQKKGDLASFEELSKYYTNVLGVPWPE